MKHILITGANSYIGTSFERYINNNYYNEYNVDTLDMTNDSWYNVDLSKYDSVFHVAGIAHSDNGKISKEKERLYYSVNTNLTIDVAKKAKKDGVKQFIFMSSAIVYGESAPIGEKKIIYRNTPVNPANCYGDSKVQAEKGISALNDETFKVVILRPPMIYGKGSKGNYPLLSKIATKSPFFPYVENERSMLFIENLCEFVRLMVENQEEGIFWPQNKEYCSTTDLVKMIAVAHNKKIIIVKGFGWILKFLGNFIGIINKAFGNLSYNNAISEYCMDYQIVDLRESIVRTETTIR